MFGGHYGQIMKTFLDSFILLSNMLKDKLLDNFRVRLLLSIDRQVKYFANIFALSKLVLELIALFLVDYESDFLLFMF